MVWLRWHVRAEDADWEGTRMDMTGNEYIRGTAQVEWWRQSWRDEAEMIRT